MTSQYDIQVSICYSYCLSICVRKGVTAGMSTLGVTEQSAQPGDCAVHTTDP